MINDPATIKTSFGPQGISFAVSPLCVLNFTWIRRQLMARRLTDTEKWKDDWFINLPLIEKMFWIYLLDNCDHAGIWKASWSEVVRHIGDRPNMENFKARLIKMSGEYYFVPKFI